MKLYFGYLLLTLILEAPVYLFLFKERPVKHRVAFWLVANCVSYPPVFFWFPHLPWPSKLAELAAEIWAPSCEIGIGAYLLHKFTRREAGLVVLANLCSWLLGKLLLA